ncbi:MAG: hypothetical protein RDV48_31225 [Candidatus Eremiobacteraeota bacterium]|nr:hypothetical protein [Candidatus Eremiobacteraeota bacterium]
MRAAKTGTPDLSVPRKRGRPRKDALSVPPFKAPEPQEASRKKRPGRPGRMLLPEISLPGQKKIAFEPMAPQKREKPAGARKTRQKKIAPPPEKAGHPSWCACPVCRPEGPHGGKVDIHILVEPELKEAFAALCKAKGAAVSTMAREALLKWIEKHQGEKEKTYEQYTIDGTVEIIEQRTGKIKARKKILTCIKSVTIGSRTYGKGERIEVTFPGSCDLAAGQKKGPWQPGGYTSQWIGNRALKISEMGREERKKRGRPKGKKKPVLAKSLHKRGKG